MVVNTRTRRALLGRKEFSAIANTGSIGALWPSPSLRRDADPGRRPEHYLQGRRLRPHGTAERGSPTWHRPLDKGPVIVTAFDDGVHHAGHLGGDAGWSPRQRSRAPNKTICGPNPTDRGKPGTKRHIVVDRKGLPLAVVLTGANRHDSMALTEEVDAVRQLRQRRGRPRKRPDKLHADKGFDFEHCRKDLRRRAITPRIARRGTDSSDRLGKHRWVVECTFACINQFRRLAIRYERHTDLYRAFLVLAAAIICFRAISRFC